MKLFYARLGAALLLLSFTACGATDPGDDGGTPIDPTKTIYELVQTDPTSSLLAQALAKADLAATLASGGPFTFFAPTDDAIKALAEGAGQNEAEFLERANLDNIFKYHIVPGRKLAAEFTDRDEFATLQGYPVTIEVTAGGDIRVEAATVITRDVLATNGVMHIVSEVLIPPALGSSVYSLNATGAAGTDVFGTAAFKELSPTQSEVVIELENTSAGELFPAHIHAGNVGDSGAIKYLLESVDGATGKSTTTLDVPYRELLEYDGYINIHLSAEQMDVIVANGEVGAGAVSPEPDARPKEAR